MPDEQCVKCGKRLDWCTCRGKRRERNIEPFNDAGLSRPKALSSLGLARMNTIERLTDEFKDHLLAGLPPSPGDEAFIRAKLKEVVYLATRVLERDPANLATETKE